MIETSITQHEGGLLSTPSSQMHLSHPRLDRASYVCLVDASSFEPSPPIAIFREHPQRPFPSQATLGRSHWNNHLISDCIVVVHRTHGHVNQEAHYGGLVLCVSEAKAWPGVIQQTGGIKDADSPWPTSLDVPLPSCSWMDGVAHLQYIVRPICNTPKGTKTGMSSSWPA